MPLSLDQYADWLAGRGLPWPAAPKVEPPKAKPHLKPLPGVRCVLWDLYGTLLAVPTGELRFEVESDFVMSAALEKTIHEFKMWQSMSRKPGQPSEYMREMYSRALHEMRAVGPPGERFPEVAADRLWGGLLKKLFQKDYAFDAGFYGSLNEYAEKVAYFFHASIQGCGAYPGAAAAVSELRAAGILQGLLADGQCFSRAQLRRALGAESLGAAMPEDLCLLSHKVGGRKPSESLFEAALEALEARGVGPGEVLHVGSDLGRDLGPAKRFGMRTALFAGDRASLKATPEMLKDDRFRPDAMVTELAQVPRLVAG